ncbi:MAG: potassium channel protein [Nocardioides sp.]
MRTFLGLEPPKRRRGKRKRPPHDPTNGSLRRIKFALTELVAVLFFGSIGYLFFGFTPLEAAYQTVTTVATVGFREVNPLTPAGQIYTMVLIIVGAGSVLYNLGLLVEAVTEGHLRTHLERRRMDNRIADLHGHVIVCGYGRVGRAAVDHLLATGYEVVIIDVDAARLAGSDRLHTIGDATDDVVLREAGIDTARALIATLDTDADTVYLTLSARALRKDLVIVSRARTVDSKQKLVLAGATRAVNPQLIGGRRLAAFALQRHVAEFVDTVLHDDSSDFRFHQIVVPPDSPWVGKPLERWDLNGGSRAQILAVRRSASAPFEVNPGPNWTPEAGAVLIAMGAPEQIAALTKLSRPAG